LLTVGKKELAELINTYQTRKFEEDIVACDTLGGKLKPCITHTLK